MVKNSEDKLLLDRLSDLCDRCDRYGSAVFGSFIDEGGLALAEDYLYPPPGVSTLSYGGYENASRRMYGVFPEWEEPDTESFPISCIRIKYTYGTKHSHRDYLGSILGLGLDRSKIGDIITADDGAYVFVCTETAGYITANLEKVGRRGVKCTLCEKDDIKIPEPEFEDIGCVAASLRLDAVVSGMLGVSRNIASKLISEERVSVNHRVRSDGAKTVVPSDVISVRGYGKFIFVGSGANTRSGRIHLQIKKYV